MKKLILIAIMVIGATMVHAGGFNPGGNTPGSGGSGGSLPPVGSPSGGGGAVPFDGGLSLILLAAGAGVGAKRKKLGLQKD